MNRLVICAVTALYVSVLLLPCGCVLVNRSVVISQPSEQNDNMLSTFAEGTRQPSGISGITMDAGGKSMDNNAAVSTSSGTANADNKRGMDDSKSKTGAKDSVEHTENGAEASGTNAVK